MSAPPPPGADLAPFVGLYGTDKPLLDIYEVEGALFVSGRGLEHQPLQRAGPSLWASEAGGVVLRSADGDSVAEIEGERFLRQDFAAAAAAQFRQQIAGDLPALRRRSTNAKPPAGASGSGEGLVEIGTVDPGIAIDMRYASANNFIGTPLYDHSAAFLERDAAQALMRAQARLLAQGYRLVVLDAYRPWAVTWLFWEAVPVGLRQFCADPASGSKHNRGCAVDVTLADAETGALVEMPSGFDEPSVRASPDYRGSTSRARWHRDLLRRAMESEAFSVDPYEWWHYDFAGWESRPIRNVPLSRLALG